MLIAWWNPLESIGNALASFFTGILLFLDSIVYSLISWVYQIILVLCRVDILDNTFSVDALINRIYIIIGVVVLFLLAYSLLRSMVNPDDAVKGKKSPATIIKDVIISIVLIALIPTIFSFAMRFQTSILENNTIGKLILGTTTTIGNQTVSSEDLIQRGGIEIASNVLRAFLHPNYANCTPNENSSDGFDCSNIQVNYSAYGVSGSGSFDEFWNIMINRGSLTAITDLADNIVDGGVTYYYIISTIAGVCVLIVMISYCFDVALRLVKLAVFQLIAPLPILARIMPGEQGNKVFSNWLKATISTYVEVFIRLAILFFGVLIINIVVQNFTTIFNDVWTGSDALTIKLFAQLFIILGIILFIQQAPKILKDITGLDSSKFKMFGNMKNAAAFVGGAVAGRTPLAGFRAMNETDKSGNLRSIGNQRSRRLANALAREQGATFGDRTTDRIRQAFGLGTKLEQADRNIERGRSISGKLQSVTNDTGRDIQIRDDKGNIIDTIGANSSVVMDEQRLNNLQHQKDLNKQAISGIEEEIRQLKEFQGVNAKFIDYRSKIKSEARDKIAEGDSAFTDALTYDGKVVASGNYKALSDFYQSRINAGASQTELAALSTQLKEAEDRLWVKYANAEISKGPNTKIGSLFQQAVDFYSTVNGYYNATTGKFEHIDPTIDITNMELFEGNGTASGLDKLSKSNNSLVDTNIFNTELTKTPYNDQNTQIDRLIAQLEELKTAAKTSPEYQKYKASDKANKISDSGKK